MKRLPTHVDGFDSILNGGLFEGGVYIFEGPPGVGKTTLANQIAYTLARRETRTLYVTMLAESHSRMLQHMEGQVFFEQREVNAKVFYVSGYRELEQGGLKSVVALLQGELVRHRAGLLVIDGLVVGGPVSMSDDSVRQFVHELQSLVSAMSCTCLVLTSGNGNALSAEQTMVDGIFPSRTTVSTGAPSAACRCGSFAAARSSAAGIPSAFLRAAFNFFRAWKVSLSRHRLEPWGRKPSRPEYRRSMQSYGPAGFFPAALRWSSVRVVPARPLWRSRLLQQQLTTRPVFFCRARNWWGLEAHGAGVGPGRRASR